MTPAFSLDSSCMVAAVCAWHQQHAAAVAEIERRLKRGERLAVAAHAVTETYAVLTRLPAPYRLSSADAWLLVQANFLQEGSVLVALTADRYAAVLRDLARQNIGGGRTYDAVIAVCALEGGASTLLTFNPRHFHPAPRGLAVVEPA